MPQPPLNNINISWHKGSFLRCTTYDIRGLDLVTLLRGPGQEHMAREQLALQCWISQLIYAWQNINRHSYSTPVQTSKEGHTVEKS